MRRFTARMATLNTYGFPIAIVLIAGVVFLVALGSFMPLVELIGKLS